MQTSESECSYEKWPWFQMVQLLLILVSVRHMKQVVAPIIIIHITRYYTG
jgi:hypothetical protein